MHPDEVAKKMEAEQTSRQTADYCQQTNAAPVGQASGPTAWQSGMNESLRTRMYRRLNDATGETQKYSRIVQILDRNPEFEEFLELVRLIPQHELYR